MKINLKNIYYITIRKVSRLIFPVLCVICKNNKNKENKRQLCQSCENKLFNNRKIIDNSLPDWIYNKYNYKDKNVKKIEYLIKYNHNRYLAQEMGMYARQYIDSFVGNVDDYILVPIPLHKDRFINRGYNQAEEISIGISRSNIYNLLIRDKETTKLWTQNINERSSQLEDAFVINKIELDRLKSNIFNNALTDIKILIIDDITTTGNTLFIARNILIKNGFNPNNIKSFALAH